MFSSPLQGKLVDTLKVVYDKLHKFSIEDNFWDFFDTAFGTEYNHATASIYRAQWQVGDFSQLPEVEIISGSILGNANGAYSSITNTIYLSDTFVNKATTTKLLATLLEEYGHFVDAHINRVDSVGDEGEIFASLVQGQSLNATELQALKAENDHATIMLNGELTQIEQSTSVLSGDSRIDTLLSGYKWGVTTLTYSFYSGGSYYGSEVGVASVSNAIKNNVRGFLENVIEPLINVDFVEVGDSSSSYGQIRYLLADTGEEYAYAAIPFSTDTNQGNINDRAGDVVLRASNDNALDTDGFQGGLGTHGYTTLIHETLHAIGLKHPGDYNGNGTGTPPFLPFAQDNLDNTVMSYNFTANEPGTPMPYDLLALQYLYGAKPFNTGNTTYTFSSVFRYSDGLMAVGSSTAPTKLTIWDSGGTDTLDFSALGLEFGGYIFDLREGGWLTTQNAFNTSTYKANGDTSGEDYFTTAYGTRLGYGVEIEKTVGTSSNDIFYGNSLDNSIYGKFGNDTLYGFAGDDTAIYSGNSSQYQISSTAGVFTIADLVANRDGTDTLNSIERVQFSDQTITLTSGNLPILSINDVVIAEGNGGATNAVFTVTRSGNTSQPTTVNYATANGTAIAGSDFTNSSGTLSFAINEATKTILVPILGDTTLESNETFFINLSNATNATIADAQGKGTINNDDTDPPQVILGTANGDNLNGGSGNDTISGLDGNDNINGGSGDDLINGGAGNDNIIGGSGDDLINGGAGSDNINGGSGNDTAVFSGNRSSYAISVNGAGLEVKWLGETDLISNIEFLKFNDQTISGLATPNINIALSSSNSVTENGAANLIYTFTRSDSFTNPLSSAFTANFSLSGTATFNTDYTQTGASSFNGTTGNITFAPNSTTAILTLDPTDDNILEPDETVVLTLSNNSNISIIESTIVDDEIPNQAPINLILSNSNIQENQPTSSIIGNFGSIDPDPNSTFTYSLVNGTGDTDNSLFTIGSNALKTNAIFNYEAKNSYNIRVRTTDQGGLSFEKEVTINVTNVNEAPIAVNAISTQNAEENSPFNFTIPTNTFNDIDVGDVLTYSAVRADGTALPTWLAFNPATKAFSGQPTSGDVGNLRVKVIATDSGSLKAENIFDIVINPQFNVINGTSASETLNGTSANDLIFGLAGNDIIFGFAGNNILVGEEGNDILVGGDGNNILVGGDGDDILVGGSGNNLLVGGSGNNLLVGGNSNDILVGGDGNNILVGRFGNDILVAGTGNDLIAFDINEVFDLTKIGQDSINDFFAPTDKIVLNKITFNALFSIAGSGFSQGNEFAVVSTDAAAQTSGALITYNNTNGNLFYNQNGSASEFGSGGLFANLNGNPNLSANNFLITG